MRTTSGRISAITGGRRPAAVVAVVFPGDEVPMPGEQGVRGHDRSDLAERSATQLLRRGGQPNALVVGKPTARAELLSKDAILALEIVNHLALLLVDPTGQSDEEKPQRVGTGTIERSLSKTSIQFLDNTGTLFGRDLAVRSNSSDWCCSADDQYRQRCWS